LSPDAFAQQRALFKEKSLLIKELLGIDPDEEARNSGSLDAEQDDPLAFLPVEKRQPLRDLDQKYFELERRVYADAHGLITSSDRATLESLRVQKSEELDALMTSAERLEYQVRESPTARRLEVELEAFQPNENEFRAICQAQIAFDSKYGSAAAGDPARGSPASDEELQAQIKMALGDQRFLDYERSKDPGYQTLLHIADRYGLPRDVPAQVFDLQQNVENQGSAVLSRSDLTDQQKQDCLQTLRAQTGTALAGLLGEQGFSVYHEYGGAWIERLGK